MSQELIYLIVITSIILGILMFDLLFVGRNVHEISFKEASLWTALWVGCAMGFYVFLRFHGLEIHGVEDMAGLEALRDKYAPSLKLAADGFAANAARYQVNMATDYLTGYVIEYTLSMDNVFVIMAILTGFGVGKKYYKEVLFWGILGAIVLRFLFIFVGAALIQKFEWMLLVFGLFLIFTGVKMFLSRNQEEHINTQDHWLVKFLARRRMIFPRYVKGYFFIKSHGRRLMTPLFMVLLLIEFTDIVFALDSIPAIFAVTRDPMLVFFSNIFAIIGLRSLFFLLARVVHLFHYLKVGISVLLAYVGVKLLAHEWLDHIGFKSVYSLYIIFGILAICIIASILFPKKPAPIEAAS